MPSLEPVLPGGAGQGGDYAGRGDLADLVVIGIGHVDIARAVHRHTVGIMKARRAAGAIAGTVLAGGAGQGGDYARPG